MGSCWCWQEQSVVQSIFPLKNTVCSFQSQICSICLSPSSQTTRKTSFCTSSLLTVFISEWLFCVFGLPPVPPLVLNIFWRRCQNELIKIQQKYSTMNMTNCWLCFHKACFSANQFLKTTAGVDIDLVPRCHQTREFVQANLTVILIVLGVMLILMSISGILKRLNNRVKSFDATLLNVKKVTHDTNIFTFDLPKGWNKIQLNIGQHLTLTATIKGQSVERKYTPISRSDVKRNSFQLLIKVYEKGLMSSYVNNMKVGEKIRVSMPFGRFNYLGRNIIKIKELNGTFNLKKYDHIYLVGGGTGLTPLYQIIQYVSEVEAPEGLGPKITLLFANRTQSDILLKSQLQDYQISNPNFKCHLSVDKAETEGWQGYTGFLDDKKLRETMPADTSKTMFAACGPPPMVNIIEKMLISNFKIPQNQFFRF